ncbi:MAG: discoidin domain-containing protein [Planctomycetes bacterium]|nr:discoidin domain-containing protein [Planctomycetota bacterium]
MKHTIKNSYQAFTGLALITFCSVSLISCGSDEATAKESKEATAKKASTENLVPLKLELPEAKIIGTPVQIKEKNLDESDVNRKPFMVSKGVVNVAKGKTVTASDDFPLIGELEFVTDGDKETDEGYFVELMEGNQWLQIDLEKSHALEALLVWHYHGQKRVYRDIIVQISDDANFKSGVTTIYNNDYDNSAKLGKGNDRPYVERNVGKLIDAKKTKGRYVRFFSNGNTANAMNHYIEIEIYAKP